MTIVQFSDEQILHELKQIWMENEVWMHYSIPGLVSANFIS